MVSPCIECDHRSECGFFIERDSFRTTGSWDCDFFRQSLGQCLQTHQKCKHLIENALDTIFLADTKTGLILEANNKAAKLLGIPLDKIIGMHQSRIRSPEEPKEYAEIFRKHAQMGLSSADTVENVIICDADGKEVPVQINTSVMQLDGQRVTCSIFRDMTEQKYSEELLKVSEERFKRLSEATFEGIRIHENGR